MGKVVTNLREGNEETKCIEVYVGIILWDFMSICIHVKSLPHIWECYA